MNGNKLTQPQSKRDSPEDFSLVVTFVKISKVLNPNRWKLSKIDFLSKQLRCRGVSETLWRFGDQIKHISKLQRIWIASVESLVINVYKILIILCHKFAYDITSNHTNYIQAGGLWKFHQPVLSCCRRCHSGVIGPLVYVLYRERTKVT